MTEFESRAVCPRDIERLYGISHATLWRMMRQPGFPVFRAGRVVRIPVDDFERWFRCGGEEVKSDGA